MLQTVFHTLKDTRGAGKGTFFFYYSKKDTKTKKETNGHWEGRSTPLL